jgi:hypothetical protein
MRSLVAAIALAALAAAGSGVHSSRASFTATGRNPANTFATAADWVAPVVTLTAPADGGFTNDTTPTLSGAAGTATGDASTVTLRVYAGTTATGTTLQTLSATRSGATWSATATALAAGTYTARATQTDAGGNTGTSATSTFTIDTTAPTPVMIAAANATGGTAGRLNAGDSITYRFSEAIAPASVLAGFTGGSTTANVRVRFTNSGTSDTFTVLDSASAANVALDTSVATDANFVNGSGATWPATMTQSGDGTFFTIVLGTAPSSGLANTVNTAKNMVWTAKAGPTDRAGNALSIAGTISETDDDVDF